VKYPWQWCFSVTLHYKSADDRLCRAGAAFRLKHNGAKGSQPPERRTSIAALPGWPLLQSLAADGREGLF